ncbi:MAG: SAVED domain-containing protein [Motilibacteraceae bacterium]
MSELLQALHDRGVPTWLDTRNLAAEPTGDGLRRVLQDPETAGAILYLTPEVADSPTIREVEAPSIMRRFARDAGFWVQPVAAGGVDYTGAADLLAGKIGTEDLSRWNIHRVDGDPATADDVVAIARRCLARRLEAIHASLPTGQPLVMRLHARGTPASFPGDHLVLDWTERFPDGAATAASWDALSLAISDVATAIRICCPGRDVVAAGTPGLPAAVLLGSAFPTRDAGQLSWRQRQPDGDLDQPWRVGDARGPELAEAAGWKATVSSHDPSAVDCAVLVNVSDDVSGAFGASHKELPSWRAVVSVGGPAAGGTLRANEVASLVRLTVRAVRDARTELGPFASVHLFLAAPAGFAVMLGTLLATLPPVVTYEYDTRRSRYGRAVSICT